MRGRPVKPRNISKEPRTWQFSPRGHIGRPGYAEIPLDQYEAMRLADFIGLSQKEAAASMGISQQTYSRILIKARKALIAAIELGKIINIKDNAIKSRIKTEEGALKSRRNPS